MQSEEQHQIEKLANENARLLDHLDEKNKIIKELENTLKEMEFDINELRKIKENKSYQEKDNKIKETKKKIYQNCQKCGVRLTNPEPGKKLCYRHQKTENEKARKQRGWLSTYSHISVYQGGSPGGGKKR